MYMNAQQSYHFPKADQQTMSYIRLLHASPNAPAVDVYANGYLIAGNLSYKQFTGYVPLFAGTYNILVYAAGQRTNPVLSTSLTVPQNSAFTVAAIGLLPDISLLPIPEIYMPYLPMPDRSYIRFTHLSPNAPAVDITFPDGSVIFRNVSYKQHTDYLTTEPGRYTLLVKISGTNQTVLTVPDVNLGPGGIYTIYAVGLAGGNPPLEAIISPDGMY